MKRIISLVIITILMLSSFTGCNFNKKETALEEEMSADLNIIYEDLIEKLPNPSDLEAQREYLLHFAGNRSIPVSYDKNNNIIMSKKATEGYEDAPASIIQCAIGTDDTLSQYQTMASALYLISNIDTHGFIRVLFTVQNEEGFVGANSISSNYLKGTNLISLTHAEKTSFTVGGAGSAEYKFSKELEWITPTHPNAYEISIKGLNGGSSGNTSGLHPNPIKTIGDFLAASKSRGVPIELASFNGGEEASSYPSSATAVVLINDNDVTKFERWFNNEASKFEDRYSDVEENYTYTMTPVETPEMVISKDDSTNVFSLLYTMINGIYLKSEEGQLVAVSNIGTVSTSTGNLNLTICARSTAEETLQEITSTFEIICGLNEVSYEMTGQTPIWHENQESPMLLQLTALFKDSYDKKIKNNTTMQNTECAVFKSRNDALDILSMSVNFDNGITEIEALMDYLESLNVPWEGQTENTSQN